MRVLPGGRRGRVLLALVVVLVAGAVAVLVFDLLGDSGVSERRKKAAVTEADNGRQVTVKAGKPFIIDLKGSEDAPWGLPSAVDASLALVSSSQDLDGSSSATFVPQETTPAVLVRAERALPCPVPGEACPPKTERFEVTIRVVG